MTGLAEYRNGGLFVDYEVLVLKNQEPGYISRFEVGDQAVVEWRALTVALLDENGRRARESLGVSEAGLPLVKILVRGLRKLGGRSRRKRGQRLRDRLLRSSLTGQCSNPPDFVNKSYSNINKTAIFYSLTD
jgi:hypothetical protein